MKTKTKRRIIVIVASIFALVVILVIFYSLLELLDSHFKSEQKRQTKIDDLVSSSLTVAAMAAKIAVSKAGEASTLAV